MTAQVYGEALYEAMRGGLAPAKAFSRLGDVLAQHGRRPLYAGALKDALARFERDEAESVATVRLARKADEKKFSSDIKNFLKEHDAADARIVVDENIIGGFIAESRGRRLDASYKKSLLTIYKSLTA